MKTDVGKTEVDVTAHPGDLLDLGIELMSPVTRALQADSLPLSHWGSPTCLCNLT